MEETHDEVIREKKLPRVGQTVRSKKYGTLWRVIEKKEVYQNTPASAANKSWKIIKNDYGNDSFDAGVGRLI